jgi:hypothetical protein
MWELIRPLIEGWVAEHRGAERRVRDVVSDGLAAAARVPRILAEAEAALGTLKRAAARSEENRRAPIALWAVALAALLLALFALLD